MCCFSTRLIFHNIAAIVVFSDLIAMLNLGILLYWNFPRSVVLIPKLNLCLRVDSSMYAKYVMKIYINQTFDYFKNACNGMFSSYMYSFLMFTFFHYSLLLLYNSRENYSSQNISSKLYALHFGV